jgi:hypothetical protein
MALEVDGFAILRTVGVHPHVFKAIVADTAKAARSLVARQIAHRNTGLKTVRDIRGLVGPEAFSLIMDSMSDAQIRSLMAKLDRHAAAAKIADGTARRHVLALADGSVQPAAEPADAPPTTLTKKKKLAPPSQPARICFKSAGAIRKR